MLIISFHARFLSLTMIHFYHTLARMMLFVCPRHKLPINLKSPGTLPYVRLGKTKRARKESGWLAIVIGKKSYFLGTVFDIFYCVMYISPYNSSFTAKLDYCPFEFLHKDVILPDYIQHDNGRDPIPVPSFYDGAKGWMFTIVKTLSLTPMVGSWFHCANLTIWEFWMEEKLVIAAVISLVLNTMGEVKYWGLESVRCWYWDSVGVGG
jgi:hypothetical protein